MKTEKQVRDGLIRHAERIGAADDLRDLFNKWDRAISLASSNERLDMARAAILEVQALLDIHAEDGLTINGEIIMSKN